MWTPPLASVEYAEAISYGETPSPKPPIAVEG